MRRLRQIGRFGEATVHGDRRESWHRLRANCRIAVWLVQELSRRLSAATHAMAVLAVAALVLFLRGDPQRWVADASTPVLLGAAVAGSIAFARWRDRRPARLQPFKNLVTGARDKERFDVATASLTELVDAELRRTQQIRGSVGLTLGGDPYLRAYERGQQPGLRTGHHGRVRSDCSPRHLPLLRPDASPPDAVTPSADLGHVALGPLRLPIRWLATVVGAWLTRTITGKVFTAGDELVVVAQHSDGRKWTVRRPLKGRHPGRHVADLGRELAARMVCDLHETDWKAADWRAVRALLDGLEQLERHQRGGGSQTLDGAGQAFAAAIANSPLFALPHYYLGVVHQQRSLDPATAAQRRAGEAAAARALFERAYGLDPDLGEACLALARLNIDETLSGLEVRDTPSRAARALTEEDRRDLEATTLRLCRTALNRLERAGRATHVVHYCIAESYFVHGKALAGDDPPGARERFARAEKHLARAGRAAALLRLVERCGARRAARSELEVQLAEVAAARATVALTSAQSSDTVDRGALLEHAAAQLEQAIRSSPDTVAHRLLQVVVSADRKQLDEAADQLCAALELDRWSIDARFHAVDLLGLEAEQGGQHAARRRAEAAAVATGSLDEAPGNPREWLEAAELVHGAARADDDLEHAAALAGVAVALEPAVSNGVSLLATLHRELGNGGTADAYDAWAANLDPTLTAESNPPPEQVAVDEWVDAWMESWLEVRGNDGATRKDVRRLERLHRANRPECRLLAHELSRLHEALGDTRAQRAWLERAASAAIPGLGGAAPRPPVDWQLALGDAQAMAGRWPEAERAYDAVVGLELPPTRVAVAGVPLSIWPEAASPWVRARALAGRGEARRWQENFEGALQDYAAAIELEPGYGRPHLLRADALAACGLWGEAASAYELLRHQIPEFADVAASSVADIAFDRASDVRDDDRARCALFARAAEGYRSALCVGMPAYTAIDAHERARRRVNLARCLIELNRRDEAETVLAGLLHELGDAPSWLLRHAAAGFEKTERPSEAEHLYRKAVEVAEQALAAAVETPGRDAPEQELHEAAQARNALAWYLTERRIKLSEARLHSVKATELANTAWASTSKPEYVALRATCHDTHGWALRWNGMLDEAVQELRIAVELQPTSEFRARLAETLEARRAAGDGDEARMQRDRIRTLAPRGASAAAAEPRLPSNGDQASGPSAPAATDDASADGALQPGAA